MDVLTIRKVGGSLMVALPKAAAEQLGLQDKQRIAFEIKKGRIVLDPKVYVRPKYKLADLIAECDADAPIPEEAQEWLDAPSVGSEIVP
jgi:antitoxin ChpS